MERSSYGDAKTHLITWIHTLSDVSISIIQLDHGIGGDPSYLVGASFASFPRSSSGLLFFRGSQCFCHGAHDDTQSDSG